MSDREQAISWTQETMGIINKMTPDITGKPFDPDWFLLRQRFEEIERQHKLSSERVIALERALREAFGAMNYMGDILNGMDAVLPEDAAKITPAFATVHAALGDK